MQTDKPAAILAAILVIVHRKISTVDLGRKSLMKVIHIYEIWKKLGDKYLNKSVYKCKLTTGVGHFGGHLDYLSLDKTQIQT